MKNATASDTLKIPAWRSQIHKPQNTEYIIAIETEIIHLIQNNIVDILFMKVHDYVYFIPGFTWYDQPHCRGISKCLAVSTVSGKRWVYWKANSCEASGSLNDRGPFEDSYLTVPCNYIFVIF